MKILDRVTNVLRRVPLWYLGACLSVNVVLLLATITFPSCRHQTVVDAGTVPTGGSSSVTATGGMPATGGASSTLLTGGTSATGGTESTGGTAATSSSTDACELAGQQLQALKCSEQKTPKGVPFVTACRNAVKSGLDWHPECIAKVKSCAEVAAAYRGCK